MSRPLRLTPTEAAVQAAWCFARRARRHYSYTTRTLSMSSVANDMRHFASWLPPRSHSPGTRQSLILGPAFPFDTALHMPTPPRRQPTVIDTGQLISLADRPAVTTWWTKERNN
ncbi:hypothetical protein GRF29_44g2131137 [Pseudopithomyces chartarum]|uniref:Uncharacterized protein n=1 Tax=Pseudopithomyces chartarum TaxID=1892770 RepID=A0AAN6M232_9PLEO|nr:hypothetical protein GRF29_44g2131137 [Pseudopithomyces chartarum]